MTVLQAISTSLYAAKSRADINFAFVERVPIARQTRCARNCGHRCECNDFNPRTFFLTS